MVLIVIRGKARILLRSSHLIATTSLLQTAKYFVSVYTLPYTCLYTAVWCWSVNTLNSFAYYFMKWFGVSADKVLQFNKICISRTPTQTLPCFLRPAHVCQARNSMLIFHALQYFTDSYIAVTVRGFLHRK